MGVELTASEDVYNFVLRRGEGQGERIEGTITKSGEIKVLKREPSFNTYPICLAGGTLIDTPGGPVPVEQLRQGMAVWTVDDSGKRTAAAVVETVMTPVPAFFQMVKLRLNDGRTVSASPGHPTAEGRALDDYRVGDTLDGALVAVVEHVAYNGEATYDILPAGSTGLYWANGILLKSTLATN
ncbi:MAG: Hint domain-containing protein [Chloroflexi bacterium]|nr:Hint domain-containing protein [Chloroflexota bacterium]